MVLLLLVGLTAVSAIEDSLLQLQTPTTNTLTGVGARRYGTWGAQSFKWNVKSKVSKYFMTEESGHNQTTKGKATLDATENSTVSELTTHGGNSTENTGKRLATNVKVVDGTLLQKKDVATFGTKMMAGTQTGTVTDVAGVAKDYAVVKGWDGQNTEIKGENNVGLGAYMELEEDNQKLTDQEVETPELVSNRDGFVKSNWSSTDKYTTWAAIGVLERMIDRATGDPYSRNADATPPPKGMGFSGHPGKVGVFKQGTDPSPTPMSAKQKEFKAYDGY